MTGASSTTLHSPESELRGRFDVLILLDTFRAPPKSTSPANAGDDRHMLGRHDTALCLDHQLALDHSMFTMEAEKEQGEDKDELDGENCKIDRQCLKAANPVEHSERVPDAVNGHCCGQSHQKGHDL